MNSGLNKKRKIGIFDSGIGGFSILKEILRSVPDALNYYISDDVSSPYGSKSQETIVERCHKLTGILLNEGVDLIVVACNTATAVAIEELRRNYKIPFVGVEPYLNIQNKGDLPNQKNTRMVVLTTEATGNNSRFLSLKRRRDPQNKIHLFKSKNLATIVEKAFYRGFGPQIKKELENELAPLKNQGFTHAILGCTHYPLLANEIENFLELECISPCPNVAAQTSNVLASESFGSKSEKVGHFLFQSTLNPRWEIRPKSLILKGLD